MPESHGSFLRDVIALPRVLYGQSSRGQAHRKRHFDDILIETKAVAVLYQELSVEMASIKGDGLA